MRLSVCSLPGALRNKVSQDHSKSLENTFSHELVYESFQNSEPSDCVTALMARGAESLRRSTGGSSSVTGGTTKAYEVDYWMRCESS